MTLLRKWSWSYPLHNNYTLQQVIYHGSAPSLVFWICSYFPLFPLPISSPLPSLTPSVRFIFLLLICWISSSFSLPSSPPCPSLSHPGGPSFHHRCPSPPLRLAPPVCKAGVSQDKEDSDYLTKEATGSWGRKTHAHIHTHTHTHICAPSYTHPSHVAAVSFSVAAVCPLHLHAHALHTYVLPFFQSHMHEHTHTHTHSSRGLGWGWGQGELELSVCLSLVFQQEAPGPARHLSGAAAADKEEAINPRKITSTDTLSHRNTAMQPDSFHLQCRQRKKEGEEEPGELTLWMEKMARHREKKKKASFPFLTLVI